MKELNLNNKYKYKVLSYDDTCLYLLDKKNKELLLELRNSNKITKEQHKSIKGQDAFSISKYLYNHIDNYDLIRNRIKNEVYESGCLYIKYGDNIDSIIYKIEAKDLHVI